MFLEQQLEAETNNRKQVESLNDQLHRQMMEYQRELSVQNSFVVPEGYAIINKSTLENLLKE